MVSTRHQGDPPVQAGALPTTAPTVQQEPDSALASPAHEHGPAAGQEHDGANSTHSSKLKHAAATNGTAHLHQQHGGSHRAIKQEQQEHPAIKPLQHQQEMHQTGAGATRSRLCGPRHSAAAAADSTAANDSPTDPEAVASSSAGAASSSDSDYVGRRAAAGRRTTRGAAVAAVVAVAADTPSPGDLDRAARAGRALRVHVKKPTELTTFTRQAPKPPRPTFSRKDREREQRRQERLQRQQQQEIQQQLRRQHQQQEGREIALRAAAAGRLTRNVLKLLPGAIDVSVDNFAAIADDSTAGISPAVAASPAAAGPLSAAGGVLAEGLAAAGISTAAAAKPRRGLQGEVLRLQQQLQQLQQLQQRKQEREAAKLSNCHAVKPQQHVSNPQWHSLRGRLQPDYRKHSLADGESDGFDGVSDAENDDQGLRTTRQTRLRAQRMVTRQRDEVLAEPDGDEDVEEGTDSEEEDADEDEDDRPPSRKKYQLRSRDNYGAIERFSPRHGNAQAATAATGPRRPSTAGRGSSDKRRDRGGYTRGGGGARRSRGGFSEPDSSDDDLLRKIRSDTHWNAFLASNQGPPGPYYAPGAPSLNTPAAAVAAAAAAAANGFLSPSRAADRRSSLHIGLEQTAAAAAGEGLAPHHGSGLATAGSGWGMWGGGQGSGGHEGSLGFRDAAATAGGREGRGGLGQELITPLQVDPSIGFEQVGGLDKYLSALKEMIFLPLLYPELFERFGVNPPRGVLFHGPPGTGKTLVARALAAQASKAAGQKVSFYMRKGADLLSKWVGEAEKQLRLLFEEAQRNQPAIIFFDEIDGLAPVRTSKQDQVHNSIVSTLLALMDGLESRGRVVLIGATNRPDALDPALRRPGRFDRELLFPLPDLTARGAILRIHSRAWQPQPEPALLDELARLTGGYCGADIKALCAEASLAALRRVYPQIYESDAKLLINPAAVVVSRQDFMTAMQGLTPAAHRATASHARSLNPVIAPCLTKTLQAALDQIKTLFPPAAATLAAAAVVASSGLPKDTTVVVSSGSLISSSSSKLLCMARPRLLIAGAAGSGQQHLAAAVLAAVEGLPVYPIGLPSLLASAGSRCVEESLVSAFTEARRAAPAIIYWPQAHLWWSAAGSGLRSALIALLDDMPQDLPLLLLATAELTVDIPAAAAVGGSSGPSSSSSRDLVVPGRHHQQQQGLEHWGLEPSLAALFPAVGTLGELIGSQQQQQEGDLRTTTGSTPFAAAAAGPGSSMLGWILLSQPGSTERQEIFRPVFQAAAAPPAPAAATAAAMPPPPLPPAPDAAVAATAAKAAAAAAAARQAYEDDQAVLRSLRIVLRTIVTRALGQKRYRLFAEPPLPDDEGGVEALQALTQPMDLLTMLYKVDHQQYLTPTAFLADAHLIVRCAEELYGDPETAAAAAATNPSPNPNRSAAPEPAAAAAGSSAGAAAASAADQPAAAVTGVGVGSLSRSFAGARAAVCKETSRAMELKDDLETQIYQLLSPDLVHCCEAIAAKGGPSAPPPGMLLPQHMLPAAAAAGVRAAAAGGGGGVGPDVNRSTRANARSSDRHIDNSLMHSDPEALMRALKQPRRSTAAAAAARASSTASEIPNDQQQQQYVAGAEVEMVDAEQPAAAAAVEDSRLTVSAAAAVFGSAAGGAAAGDDAQHRLQQQQELHDALKPIETNGQGRKRAAAAADLGQGERPSKQQATTAAPANGYVDAAAALVEQLGHQADGQLDVQADRAAASGAAADVAAQPKAADVIRAADLLQRLVPATSGMKLSELELLYARLCRIVVANEAEVLRDRVLDKMSWVIGDAEQLAAALPVENV